SRGVPRWARMRRVAWTEGAISAEERRRGAEGEDAAAAPGDCRSGIGRTIRSGVEGGARSRLRRACRSAVPATKAVVVVHDGKVIAERYAAGVGIDTPLPGFSMTKSMVNALIGILTQQGLVTPSMPAPIPEWHGADDPRREIEVEHLMRMTSGLDLDETNSGFDPSSRMFLQDDTAAYAVNTKM